MSKLLCISWICLTLNCGKGSYVSPNSLYEVPFVAIWLPCGVAFFLEQGICVVTWSCLCSLQHQKLMLHRFARRDWLCQEMECHSFSVTSRRLRRVLCQCIFLFDDYRVRTLVSLVACLRLFGWCVFSYVFWIWFRMWFHKVMSNFTSIQSNVSNIKTCKTTHIGCSNNFIILLILLWLLIWVIQWYIREWQ